MLHLVSLLFLKLNSHFSLVSVWILCAHGDSRLGGDPGALLLLLLLLLLLVVRLRHPGGGGGVAEIRLELQKQQHFRNIFNEKRVVSHTRYVS